jgi:hypothetical protein
MERPDSVQTPCPPRQGEPLKFSSRKTAYLLRLGQQAIELAVYMAIVALMACLAYVASILVREIFR